MQLLPVGRLSRPKNQEDDWKWQARHAVHTQESLAQHIKLFPEEVGGCIRAMHMGLPISITPYYLGLIDPEDPQCPIRRQCIPSSAEADHTPGDMADPLGEEEHQVAPHLVQRYPDRALLLVTDRCGVYCRFCTRSRMVGHGGGAQSMEALEPAFRHLEQHPQIQEVIVSGGDPALMSDERIEEVLSRLHAITSVGNVRFATRTPVTLPQRVTKGFCRALKAHPCLWIMTHFNHPRELTGQARRACLELTDHGIPVMNHTVLLRGINDYERTLEELFRGLVRMRVKPYYLLQADPVKGTGHLRTPLEVGTRIMEQLQGRVSGLALPKFIVDTPGGHGKVQLQASPIVKQAPGVTTLRTFRTDAVDYLDP